MLPRSHRAPRTIHESSIPPPIRIASAGRSSVYAALAALQRDAFIDARWDHSGSHPRRLVQINGDGSDALQAEQALRGVIATPSPNASLPNASLPSASFQEATS